MKAGSLRRLLQYQTKTETSDALGQMIPTWLTVYTTWAETREPRGSEAITAQQVEAFVSLVIECRFPGYTFDPRGRLVDITDPGTTNYLNIVWSHDPDGRRRKLITMATDVVTPGATDNSNL